METKNIERLRHYTVLENSDVNHKFLTLDEGNDQESVIPLNESDSEGICRVCANSNSHLVPIFEGQGLQLDLVTKMHKYLPIQVTENDTLSTQLCYHCTITIIAFNDIVEGCLEAEQKLIQLQEDKIQKISEERRADLTFEQAEIIKDPQEDEIEIQQAQIVVELSIDKDGENSQETGLEKTETSRSEVARDFLGLLRVTKISKPLLTSSTPEASKSNERSVTVPELPEVLSRSLSSSPNKTPPDDLPNTFSDKRKKRTSLQNSKSKLPPEKKEKHRKSTLQRKRLTCQAHDGQKLYTCHVCGKQFGQSGSLYYHLKHVHGGVKDHACDICGRRFAMKTAMQDHRRIHTGERPYVCDTCGKSFKTTATLYIHSKIHLDQFPYKCSYCDKLFKFKQQMLGHETTHTGIKNHTCDTCGKSFGVKWDLTRHLRIHSTEKPFVCDQCGMSFGQKRYLTSHKRIRHKTE
ncbi:zinc finger protein 37 isoform X3 [Diachasma alloeum]|uniref:zinc finger protein 37 isoform X3 n=1 Tax=Diachasma alloeum TaxID=454923 RepID=UPI0007384A27|nr:zinc finger protein 37 isoform X3 [Diachasma alloeum]